MARDLTSIPEFARPWAERCLMSAADMSDDDIRNVGDWLAALAIERPRLVESPGRLVRMTWAQAMDVQRKWHDAIAAKTMRLTAEMKGFGGAPEDVETVLELGGGYRWVRITSPEGLDYEGAAMGHCVGQGGYDEGCTILSLRDADNLPHCTVEWAAGKRIVEQVQGRANQQVVERYHGMVRSLADHLQPAEVRGAAKFGHFFAAVNGRPARLMTCQELRDGDRVVGNLSLQGNSLLHLPVGLQVSNSFHLTACSALTHLPDGLVVGNVLNLSDCTSLTHLPDDMVVKGSLHLEGCTALTHLPDDMVVRGALFLGGCNSMSRLPEGLVVEGDLHVPNCTSLTHLPADLVVKGSLHLEGCTALTHLPDDMVVSGSFHVFNCTSLTHLPDDMVVAGSLYLSGCTSLTNLPDGLQVGGDLYLNGCTSLTHLPEGLTANRSLYLAGCMALKHLPEGMAVRGNLALNKCTSLTRLPDEMQVVGSIILPSGQRVRSLGEARAWFAVRFPAEAPAPCLT